MIEPDHTQNISNDCHFFCFHKPPSPYWHGHRSTFERSIALRCTSRKLRPTTTSKRETSCSSVRSTLHRYNSFRRANAFTWEANMRKQLEPFKAHHQICGYNGEVDKLTVAIVRVDKWINSQPVMQCVVTSHNFEPWSTWWAVCSQRELERGWEQQAGRQRCRRESTERACRRERQTSRSRSLRGSPEKFVNVETDLYDCLNIAISTQTFERSSLVTDDSSSSANSRPLSAWSHLKSTVH